MSREVYGLYKQTRDAAWQALIDYNVSSLPVSVVKIANNADIDIIKNSEVKELRKGEVGVSILLDKKWYIVYDNSVSQARCRYTIAHELGHIFLGHPLLLGYHARKFQINKPAVEWQSDRFAIGLLAPACVLWGLNLHSVDEIRTVCNISYAATEIRAERMKVLYKRNKFLTSPLERKVYSQFQNYINSYNVNQHIDFVDN